METTRIPCPLVINVTWELNKSIECIVDQRNEAVYLLGGWHDSNMTERMLPRKEITRFHTRTNHWETLPFTLPACFDDETSRGMNYNLTTQVLDGFLVILTCLGECWMKNIDADSDWQRMPDLHHVFDHYLAPYLQSTILLVNK